MTGNELCVAVFVNPVLRRLPEPQQTPFLRQAAGYLGALMPFWYATSFVLTAVTAYMFHHGNCAGPNLAAWSALLQAAIILMTVIFLVPINNRLSKLTEDETGWTSAAVRWDHLHQVRVGLLLAALILLVRMLR